jgi:hypothetical protein
VGLDWEEIEMNYLEPYVLRDPRSNDLTELTFVLFFVYPVLRTEGGVEFLWNSPNHSVHEPPHPITKPNATTFRQQRPTIQNGTCI